MEAWKRRLLKNGRKKKQKLGQIGQMVSSLPIEDSNLGERNRGEREPSDDVPGPKNQKKGLCHVEIKETTR